MKKLLIILIIFCIAPIFIIGQNFDTIFNPYLLIEQNYDGSYDSTYVPPGDDPVMSNREHLENTVWLGNENQGAIPYDITYADGNVYVYGDRRIVALDSETNQIQASIDVSDYSSTLITRHRTYKWISEKRLAHNGNGKLFAVTDKLEIKVINTSSNSIEHTIPKPDYDGLAEDVYHYYLLLKYDNRNNKIFLAANYIGTSSLGFLFVYDANTYELEESFEFDEFIYDFEFNNYHDIFYLSSGDNLFIYDSKVFDLLYSIEDQEFDFGPIVYVDDPQDELHKVFCLTGKSSGTSLVINGDDYSSNMSYVQNLLHFSFVNAIYNPEINVVQASYFKRTIPVETGFVGIDAINNTRISDIDVPHDPALNCATKGDKTFFTGKKHLYVLSGQSGNSLNSIQLGNKPYLHGIVCTDAEDNSIYITSAVGSELFVLNQNLAIQDVINVGGHVYFSILNENYNKVYFYNKGFDDSKKLFILNTLNNQVSTIDLGFAISDATYNEMDERLYVTYFNKLNNSTTITSINGLTNEIIPSEEITINYPRCTGLFWAAPNRLIISVKRANENIHHQLVIYDLETGQSERIIILGLYPSAEHLTGKVLTNFAFSKYSGKIAVSLKKVDPFGGDPYSVSRGKVIVIDPDNSFQTINQMYSPDKLKFTNNGNKIFLIHKNFGYWPNYFTSIDLNSNQTTQHIIPENDEAVDIDMSPQNLLFLSRHDEHSQIEVFNCNDNTFMSPLIAEGPIVSLKYNTNNEKLYAFVPWNFKDNLEMQVLGFNTTLRTYSKIHLDQFESMHFSPFFGFSTFLNDLTIDNNNKLYLGCGGHSNIKVVDCSEYQDELYIYKGFNWLSFPKLQRVNNDPFNAQTLLENLEPTPNAIEMEGRNDVDNLGLFIFKDQEDWIYQGLTEVQSTRGYKLTTSNSATTVLPLTGTDLDPYYPVSIFTGEDGEHENWVGYFLHETQDPFDALKNVLPALKSITGQYWAAANIGTQLHPLWITTPPYPLEYGDMLILKCFYDTQFTWKRAPHSIAGLEYIQPQEFVYEEQADYTGFFIEVDTTDPPIEIGAFAGDSCIGACIVNPSDSLVLLRGFVEEGSGDSISFESYYGEKSSKNTRLNQYYVYNTETKRHEKRSIATNENKDFYLVSLKTSGGSSLSLLDNDMLLTVYPNPAREWINIEYTMRDDAEITIEIYDLYGRLIGRPESGKQSAGHHSTRWKLIDPSGKKLKPGLYIVLSKSSGITNTKKVMIN